MAGGKTVCLVGSLLRNISRDLANEVIINFSQQVDGEMFDGLLARLFSIMDKDLLQSYFPINATAVNNAMLESGYDLWTERGPEFQSYLQ